MHTCRDTGARADSHFELLAVEASRGEREAHDFAPFARSLIFPRRDGACALEPQQHSAGDESGTVVRSDPPASADGCDHRRLSIWALDGTRQRARPLAAAAMSCPCNGDIDRCAGSRRRAGSEEARKLDVVMNALARAEMLMLRRRTSLALATLKERPV
jgi:hypothetical protein